MRKENFVKSFPTHEDMLQVDRLLNIETSLPLIHDIVQHILESGGKRIRPLLTILSAHLSNYTGSLHIPLAACIELLHTATLLHDDVVDESLDRRGRPAVHLLWGNKAAILVGDFLLSHAFDLMIETKNLEALKVIAHATSCISQAELLQLTQIGNMKISIDTYLEIISGKTAALFKAAVHIGGILGHLSEAEQHALQTYGHSLGMIFQLIDDALDYGLPDGCIIGDDFKERKVTLPVLLAQDLAPDFWENHFGDPAFLEQAVALMKKENIYEGITQYVHIFYEQAHLSLNFFPAGEYRTLFQDMLDFCMKRRG